MEMLMIIGVVLIIVLFICVINNYGTPKLKRIELIKTFDGQYRISALYADGQRVYMSWPDKLWFPDSSEFYKITTLSSYDDAMAAYDWIVNFKKQDTTPIILKSHKITP